jgi:hypothetical protein
MAIYVDDKKVKMPFKIGLLISESPINKDFLLQY